MAAPQIDSNSLTIFEGQIITISTDNLEASAPGIPPGDIIFTINSPLFGGFFLNGTETSEFSQEDIFRGDVQFRHDGSNSAPQYTVTARVGDEAAEASEPMVSFTPFNDGPRFLNAALSISEGETVILTRDNLLTTDEEGESAPEELTYEILSVTNGEFQRVGDGTPLGEGATFTQADIDAEAIQFIHDGSETSPSYRLQVTDSGIPESPTPKSVRRTVFPNFTPVNDPPVAEDDLAFPGDEDTLITGNVLTNATDPEDDPLTATVVTDVTNGTLTLNPDGSFEYLPNENFNGTDTFTYEVSDGNGGTDQATVTLTVAAVNDPPVAEDDLAFPGDEDTPITGNVLANATDPEGDTLTATVVTDVTNGTLTLNPDGSFEYLPNENFNGTDTFTYEVSDGNGGTDQATVTLTVNPINDPPVAEDDLAFPGDEDTLITGNVLTNATDPEDDPLTATVVTDVTNGTLTLNPDGSFEYLPNENFNGTDTFTYEVSDGNGGTDQATVTLTVAAVNDPPVAEDDLAFPGDEDTPITGNVLANATDPEGDTLTATVVTDVTNGTLTLNPDGSFEYLPNENFNGTDTFTYEVSDGNGGTDQATVTLTVNPINDPPVAEDDLAFPGDEDTLITGNVLTNATDPEDDPLTATVVTDVTNGTLTLNPDGSFEYLPNENFNGTDTFTYEVSDGNGGTDQATVTLTVAAVNDDPAFISNTLTIDEGATVSFTADNLAADDIDSLRGRLTFEISEVVGGTFFLNGQPLGAGETFTTASISFGELTFTDDGDEAPPSYSVTVRDPEGGFVSGAAEVFFTTVNDAPVLVTNTFVISEGQRLALNEGGNVNLLAEDDTASDAELIYSVSNVVGGGFFDLNAAPIESFTQAQLNNGDVFFVHNDEEIAPSFDIAVSDGEASTDPTPGVIEFISVNDAPTLETVQLSVTEGATIPLTPDNFVGSDPDTEAANLTFEVSDLAGGQFNLFEGGVVAAEAITSFSQSQLIAGQIQFVDDGDQLPPSFNLTLTDGEFTTAPVPVTITEFINVNDPPTAVDDSGEGFTTSEDVVLTTPDILENDGDDDPEDTISISQIAGIDVSQGEITIPSGALVSVAEDGRLNYSPNGAFDDLAPGESRLDTFEYTLSDSAGATDTATVEIVVTGVNDAPTLAANTLSLFKGQTVVISANNLLVNDPDTPLNEQVFTLSEVTGGEFQLNGEVTTTFSQQDIAQGLVSFIHDGGEAPPSYEVSVSDGLATTDPAAVTIDTFIPVSDIRGVFDYEQFLRFQVPTAEVAVPTDAVDGLLLAQFFDESFYLNQNPDVADAVNAGVFSSGYQHFVLSGLAEGRNPSLLYDEAFYLANNEDVAQAVTSGVFTSGLVHFLQAGHEEGRDPSALFRQRDYLTNNADVETAIESGAVQSGFDHFINFGANEDRLPPLYLYNEEFYLSSNPDVAAAVQTGFFTDGFAHFASIGQSEGRNPSSLFDQADYLAANPDIAAAVAGGTFSSGFQHYVAFGRFEERAVF
ncbi:MAG: tandem-95 repeat protein [Leptolyngbya sp. SIO1E4]|nr:tandem-95 repeat protein [Leptolyngbya sp. SIO1E4]